MSRTRIAVAGAGLIGLRHIEEIQKSESAELAAIVDIMSQAVGVAEKEGVALFGSLAELFAEGNAQGVILATPNKLHEVVQSGILGKLVAVMGSAVFYKADSGYYDGPYAWRKEPGGGGPILINVIHEIGNLRSMVGEIEAVQALASNATRGFNVEDTVSINLRFENGALGSFLLSDTAACPRSWEQTSQKNKAYSTYEDEDAYTIIGSFGSLSVPTMRVKFYEKAEDRSWFKPFKSKTVPLQREDPLALQIEHFAAVIRGEAQPVVTCRDGLQNLRIVDAIAESARTGRIVETI